ncbi:MAG: glycosyltransferase family 2 protein [Herpetosiphon sp.]
MPTAYQTGIDTALRLGADLIVNTDGDGQYAGQDIPALVAPLVDRRADIVVGNRQTDQLQHFSIQKKLLQKLGSSIVRWASGTEVPDVVSGFRALNREAALTIFVTSDFSYTVESLIQAGKRRLIVTHVPINASPTRPSRLHRGNWHFVKRQASTIVRTYASYEPLRTFSYIALPFVAVGVGFLLRATYVFARIHLPVVFGSNFRGANYQSLVIGGVSLTIGFVVFLFGLLADRIGSNRRLLEELLYRQRRSEFEAYKWRRDQDQYAENGDGVFRTVQPPEEILKWEAVDKPEPERAASVGGQV